MKKLVEMTIEEFIETLSSDAPAPGGGSVSALAGANGCGLIAMAGNLSFHKKKFIALDDKIKDTFKNNIQQFEDNKRKFIDYIDEDTQVFQALMKAFRMPKSTEEEKKKRSTEIQKATMETIRVPMEVCQLAIESLRLVESIMPYANKNTISDQGVGVMMLHNAIEGSAMNVLINLPGLKEEHLVKAYRKEVHLIRQEAMGLKENLLENINLL